MARIEMHALCKSFEGTEVLQDVDLTIDDGELVVLVGPSGCGKSTLLRMIAGLEPITAGEMRIDGRVINDVPPRDRDIAMVFQSYALYPHMNVRRNMGFSMEIRRRPEAERREPVDQASRTLGLGQLLERYPKALSGGQRQRVAMGRAIVRDPKAFLFDEPLSNLDAALRVEMRLEIAQLHQRLGTTMIYVTHDQVEAMTLADRIVVLNGGRIQQVGSPMELYDRPANAFVAQFIGSPTMNLFDARNGSLWDQTRFGAPPQTAKIGIRPEHLKLGTMEGADLVAQAKLVERLGSDTNIYAEAEELGPILARIHGNAPVKSGDHFGLSVQQDKLHFFNQTGERAD